MADIPYIDGRIPFREKMRRAMAARMADGGVVAQPKGGRPQALQQFESVDPKLAPTVQAVFAANPALAAHQADFAVITGKPMSKGTGQLESYPPGELSNPIPGKATTEVYNQDPAALKNLITGDMLHHLGAVDDKTGQPIDPKWRALKVQLLQSMTPQQQAVNQQAYDYYRSKGDPRSFDDFMDQSRGDEFIMGSLTPDKADYWRGHPGSHAESVYTPAQEAILQQMRDHLHGYANGGTVTGAPRIISLDDADTMLQGLPDATAGAPTPLPSAPKPPKVISLEDADQMLQSQPAMPAQPSPPVARNFATDVEAAGKNLVKGAEEAGTSALRGFAEIRAEGAPDRVKDFQRIDSGDPTLSWKTVKIDGGPGLAITDQQGNGVPFFVKPGDPLFDYITTPANRAAIFKKAQGATDPRQDPAYIQTLDWDAATKKALPTTDAQDQDFWTGQLPQGLGSTATFFAAGAAAGPFGVGALSSGSNADQQFNDAILHGADLKTAFKAANQGSAIGLTELVPVEAVLSRLDGATGGWVRRGIAKMLIGGTTEGAQEFTQQILNNLSASSLYDPSRKLLEGAGQNAAAGGFSGALLGFLTGLVHAKAHGAKPAAEPGSSTSTPAPAEVTSVPAGAAPADAVFGGAEPAAPTPQPTPLPKPTLQSVLSDQRSVADIQAEHQAQMDAHLQAQRVAEIQSDLPAGYTAQAQGAGITVQDATGRQVAQAPSIGAADLTKMNQDIADHLEHPNGAGTRTDPVRVTNPDDLTIAGAQVDQGATPAQKLAGNYKLGHLDWKGLQVSVETPKGGVRTAADGSWEVRDYPAAYGHIKGTEGADGDHVDVFVGDDLNANQVYVVDQVDPDTGKFDEAKAFIGFPNEQAAAAVHGAAYSDGKARVGAVTPMSVEQFKAWLKNGKTGEPVSYQGPAEAPATEQQQVQVPQRIMDYVTRGGSLDPNAVASGLGFSPGFARMALARLAARGLIRMTPDGRFQRLARRNAPMDAITFLQTQGGLHDDEGHNLLQGRNAQRQNPAYGPLIRRNGMSVDDAGEALHEAGYFGHPEEAPRPSTSDVLELLDRSLAGRRIYPLNDFDAALEQGQRAVNSRARDLADQEAQRTIEEYGLSNVTPAERSAVVDLMVNHGWDAGRAVDEVFERAAIQMEQELAEKAREYDDLTRPALGAAAGPRSEFTEASGIAAEPHAAGPNGGAQGRVEPRESREASPEAERLSQRPPAGPRSFSADRTAQGNQSVIPGAERLSDRELAQRRIEATLRARTEQKPADEGLFDLGARNQNELFQASPAFDRQLAAVETNRWHGNAPLVLGHTPDVFRALGAGQRPLIMPVDVARKVMLDKHGIPREVLAQLPGALERPIMVFGSDTSPGDLVALLDLRHGDRHLVAAVHLNRQQGNIVVNRLASVYPKDSAEAVRTWAQKGLLRYVDRAKATAWLEREGAPNSPARPPISGQARRPTELQSLIGGPERGGSKVLTDADVFKGGNRERRQTIQIATGVQAQVTPEYGAAREGLIRDLKAMARQVLGQRANVAVFDTMSTAQEGHPITGAYNAADRLIAIALADANGAPRTADQLVGTLLHEGGIHYLRDLGVLDGRQWRILENQAPTWRKEFQIDERYGHYAGRGYSGQQLDAMLNEEAIAEAIAHYQNGRRYGPGVNSIMEAIRRFLDRIRNVLSGRGFKDWGDVFSDIGTGKLAGEADRQAAGTGRGESMEQQPDRLAAPFYSKLAREVDAASQPKASGDQWLATLRNKGVKDEELAWTGADDFLKGKPSVTKAELQDFIRANQVEVREVVNGGGQANEYSTADVTARAHELADHIGEDWNELGPVGRQRFEDEARRELEGGNQTQYEEHTLPGGENYHELLLTLPEREVQQAKASLTWAQRPGREIWAGTTADNRHYYVIERLGNGKYWMKSPSGLQETFDTLDAAKAKAAEYATNSMARPDTANFRGGHFRTPNVLAHVRFNSRNDQHGNRVLFIEEIQSDWHQQGRRQGYQSPRVRPAAEWRQMIDAATRRGDHDEAGRLAMEAATDDPSERHVPNAPFKSTWQELAFRRAVKWAADHGYDRIAWTTGEQQADRYDLSKQITRITWNKNPSEAEEGKIYVAAHKDDRGNVVFSGNQTPREIEETFGKDIADKIVNGGSYGTLTGVDLKVGGEGMKGFYDKILPSYAAKLGKKFGAKVGETYLTAPGSGIANDNLQKAAAIGAVPVHSMDITPAMRDTARREGFPLFQERPADQKIERSPRTRQRFMQDAIRAGQPVDCAFRIPFDIFGGIAKGGEWRPGKYLTDQARHILVDAQLPDRAPFGRWLGPAIEGARRGLINRYGQDAGYVAREHERGLEERRIATQGLDILQKLAQANIGPAEAKVMHGILTGEAVGDEAMSKLAQPIREAIDDLGQQAVDLGLISAESYERNKGSYLHRVYMGHEAERTGAAKLVHEWAASRRKKLLGDTMKGRGIYLPAPADAVIGRKMRVWDKVDADGKLIKRIIAEENAKPKTDGYTDRGTWEVRRGNDGKPVLWRDYTKAERLRMGEILDARYAIGRTFSLMAHDLATGRFYRDVATNPQWSTSKAPEDGTWKSAGDYKGVARDHAIEWVKVPDSKITGTDKPRWGALADKYVRSEIWRDMNELDQMHRGGLWSTLLNQWKLNKTARSPVTHMNNVMSNFILADLADVTAVDLVKGVTGMVKGSDTYKQARDLGAFGNDLVSQEIHRKHLEPVLRELLKGNMADSANSNVSHRFGMLSRASRALWGGVKATDHAAQALYRIEDDVFRAAAVESRLRQGATMKEAADFARKQFIDYDIRAPWINKARRTVFPFLAYPYQAIPVLAASIAHRPWKIAKIFTLLYMANALAYALWPSKDDEDKERQSLDDSQQGMTWLGMPRMMRLWTDMRGNPTFLDLTRWVPGGDVFDLNQGNSALPIPAPLMPGGPLELAGEFLLNTQMFNGKPITNSLSDTPGEKVAKVAQWFWNSVMPSFMSSYTANKVGRAVSGATDPQGRPYSLPQALASTVGIKVKSQDVAAGLGWHDYDLKQADKDLATQERQAGKQYARGLMSKDDYAATIANIEQKRRDIMKKRAELGR
jgi:hypothetical protein